MAVTVNDSICPLPVEIVQIRSERSPSEWRRCRSGPTTGYSTERHGDRSLRDSGGVKRPLDIAQLFKENNHQSKGPGEKNARHGQNSDAPPEMV